MLTFTRAQQLAMLGADERLLRNSIQKRVKEDYQQIIQGVPDDLVKLMINHGIDVARKFGLGSPVDIAGFVYIMFEVGPEFYRQPQIRMILENPSIPPSNKLQKLFTDVSPESWQQVVAVLPKLTWFPELRKMEK
ncbi:hypothetical protein [Methylobacter sp. YRD-M1]|uniref:hypothetical protein n=1 Tax=Methylobacter sp. YRD-M1 TaxID=2911520 RepID=UPI00227B1F93|nr:hypothetical protein [Methylobacter sp. YRD-M1]WAK04306.1 hypothetical protein LZ558_21795 [Methylobacter sp. YRD-M1]